MILINQENFTTNLITELLRYKVSGLWRPCYNAPGDPQVKEIIKRSD